MSCLLSIRQEAMYSFIRRTVRSEVRILGSGLHSGVPVEVIIHPSNEGIAFRVGSTRVRAHPSNVTDTTRSTRLGEVGTVEHLMSAFAGLEITDAEVELTYPELPGLDGSAIEFVTAILATGKEDIGQAEVPEVFGRLYLQEEGGLEVAIAKGDGRWRCVFATDDRWPGAQTFELDDCVGGYTDQIARARTFAFEEELPMIRQMELGKGLDESSALILGASGYVNEARFHDEPVRHKLLDLIGDLYLSGVPVRALSVVAERTGHRANVRAAALLAQAVGNVTL